MPTDLELIKQLEKEIGFELQREGNLNTGVLNRGAYQANNDERVVRLAINDRHLKVVPETIAKLKYLDVLSLHSNELNTVPAEFKYLTRLTTLFLSFNKLTTLPLVITELTKLRWLFLQYNMLSALTPEIKQLTSLTRLDLMKNQLSTLPPEISQLTKLTSLDLEDNQLSTLPPEISQLTKLTKLYLGSNQLSTLPPEITQLTKLKHLSLNNNPLKQPPPEIATGKDNIARICNYFEELEAQGEGYVYEAKLILVGEPGAGKTSLAKKLMNPKYGLSPTEPMTKGIDVEKWRFSYSKKIPFQCNIWDFGGQDIMHATHRYFLTKRSLYVVVADNRKEDTDFYYWLNILELLSGKSPVLIVLNEKHKYKKYVPENILKSFRSVQRVYNVNLANNMGLADLSKAIQQNMCALPHVGKDRIPKKWVLIRNDLEKDKRNYITLSDYLKICKDNGIEDEEKAGYISEFLHDLGVILHFQKDPILRNTVILNTRWATEAVYQILFDNTIIENGGEFDSSDLGRVWHQAHYRDNHGELLQLMLNFELCYNIRDSEKYIIPDLLPEKSSSDRDFWTDERLKEKGLLHFEYRYDFIPKGIISRLIVRMNKYIFNKQQWKSGVVLQSGNSLAEITENFDKRVLKIRIAGNDRQDALVIISKEIKDLHDTFENLLPHEMVPCNCPECQKNEVPHFFDYDELKQYKQEGEQYIKCRVGKIKNVGVLPLITDVFIKVELDGDEATRLLEKKGVTLKLYQNVKQTVIQKQEAKLEAKQAVQIDIDVKVDLPAIQDDFAELKKTIADIDPKLEKELDKIEDSLDDVTPESDKEKLAKPMNRMRRFLEKVADEKSDFHKAIKTAKKGAEIAQKVGKTYNKFAQWLALPQVPDLFLGK